MSENKLVSIIIPVHNSESTIEECLNSVVDQDYENIEIIIVINNSADDSKKIINNFNNSEIVKISTDTPGVSNARNLGLSRANGEYVTFVDSDDFIMPNHISSMMNLISKTSAQIVICKMAREKKLLRFGNKFSQSNNMEFCKDIFLDPEVNGYVCNKIYQADILKNVRFDTDLVFGEDTKFNIEVGLNSRNITISEARTYFYRQNTSSITGEIYSLGKRIDSRLYNLKLSLTRILVITEDYPMLYNIVKAKYVDILVHTYLISRTSKNEHQYRSEISQVRKEIFENFSWYMFKNNTSLKKKVKLIIALSIPKVFLIRKRLLSLD